MSDAYVTFEGVTYRRPLPSGNSFEIEFEGHSYVIPSFAVGADSEIWVGSINETTGTLIVFERIAKEKGILGTTGETKIGIPLKRHRLPEPLELMPVERLDKIRAALQRLADAGGCWLQGSTDLMRSGLPPVGKEEVTIAVFEWEDDADFFAAAPNTLTDLLEENLKLRIWVETVTKARQRS